ncbi:hypothetical protein NDU88_011533 [Pleurodeles waltl]|uniref:Uncharacterized protein n=1 Tax=Pleurodeles waltl TaxID=8319 RepID=A0AAV7QXI8_PLEWA|nr:hypothetical protein NDU88_011533 [Pleurodeles waltl]
MQKSEPRGCSRPGAPLAAGDMAAAAQQVDGGAAADRRCGRPAVTPPGAAISNKGTRGQMECERQAAVGGTRGRSDQVSAGVCEEALAG